MLQYFHCHATAFDLAERLQSATKNNKGAQQVVYILHTVACKLTSAVGEPYSLGSQKTSSLHWWRNK